MINVSAFAELLYIVSSYEKGRVKTSGLWKRKYVESLKKSLEIMSLITNIISSNKEISHNEMSCLKEFIYKNEGIMFIGISNVEVLFDKKNSIVFSPNDFKNTIVLMKCIIFEIKKLLCTKQKNYKSQISYLLRAFHNLPKVFLVSNYSSIFNLEIQPIDEKVAFEYANSYLIHINKDIFQITQGTVLRVDTKIK